MLLQMQKNNRMSVPKFGAWEQKSGSSPSNYTVMFSEARANRKQHRSEHAHHSVGNDQDLRAKQYPPMEEDYGRVRLLEPQFFIFCPVR